MRMYLQPCERSDLLAYAAYWQVRGRKLHHYVGSYSKFLEQRKERDAQLAAQAMAQADEIARLQSFVDRFGAKVRPACSLTFAYAFLAVMSGISHESIIQCCECGTHVPRP